MFVALDDAQSEKNCFLGFGQHQVGYTSCTAPVPVLVPYLHYNVYVQSTSERTAVASSHVKKVYIVHSTCTLQYWFEREHS